MTNEQNNSPLNLVTIVTSAVVLLDGVTTYIGMTQAVEAKEWMQYIFVFVVAISTMFYVVCLRWAKQQLKELTGYLNSVLKLLVPLLFLLFLAIDSWSSFEFLSKYVVKNINFQENLLALLILIAGTVVCASAPIVLAFYNDIRQKLI